jgi:alpha-glucosidase
MRHPMQWDAGPSAGFTTGTPWLAPTSPEERNVERQRDDPGSLLSLYRRLIELRPTLGRGFRMLDAEPGVVSYERGGHTVAVNTSDKPRTPPPGEAVLATHDGDGLPPHSALVVRN